MDVFIIRSSNIIANDFYEDQGGGGGGLLIYRNPFLRLGVRKLKHWLDCIALLVPILLESSEKKGKTIWLKKFEAAPEKTVQEFVQLGKSMNVDDRVVEALEEFVCQGYCRNFKDASLSDVRWHLFSKSAKNGID